MAYDRVYVLVRPGKRAGAAQTVARWLRFLVPAAVLLTSSAALPAEAFEEDAVVISVDADEVVSGPLSLADSIARGRRGGARGGRA